MATVLTRGPPPGMRVVRLIDGGKGQGEARSGKYGPAIGRVAEADGNRTRLTELLGHVGFRGRGGHQTP